MKVTVYMKSGNKRMLCNLLSTLAAVILYLHGKS